MTDLPKTWREEHAKKQSEFYNWMGQSVSNWAFADEALFNVFRACVGAPYEQCAIIYYRLPGLDIRASMTDEIVLSKLPRKDDGEHDHDDVTRWKEAKKRFIDLLSVRRRIAHQQVHVALLASELTDTGEPADGATWITAFEIYASVHERLRESGSVHFQDYKKPPLNVKDLEDHSANVIAVTHELELLLKDVLPKWTGPFVPKSAPTS